MTEVGQLRPIEMRLLEELTGMRTGYVLDFSDVSAPSTTSCQS